MFKSYFDTLHILELSLALALLFCSVISFNQKNYRTSVMLLLASGLVLRWFIITLDPFLNTWDEQTHALVAKNMMIHPLKPMLFNAPVLPFDFRDWTGNSVWLHKQPLFLWQMSLSMKIFGVNEIAVRVPGMIMSVLMILLIYRTGALSMNRGIGYIAAMLFAYGNFSLELLSGWMNTDHNDTAFIFYVSASLWAFTEYYFNPKKRWIVFIGVFAGCAVLIKWLTGLFVFFVWLSAILCDKARRGQMKSYLELLPAVFISLLIVLPWIIYTYLAFPLEAGFESALSTQHFFSCIEHHCGNFFYHINKIDELYWPGAKLMLLPALFFCYKYMKTKSLALANISGIVFIYLFFSIAKTKMPAFTTMINMPVYLAFAAFIYGLWQAIRLRKRIPHFLYIFLLSVILSAMAVFELNIEKIQYIHTSWRPEQAKLRALKETDRRIFTSIRHKYTGTDYVVFNVPVQESASCMFYTSLTAYDFIPDEKTLGSLVKQGKIPVIIQRDSLPSYIRELKNIEIVTDNE